MAALAGPHAAAGIEPPPPGLLVIFGASGDLTSRLLVPDLYGLFLEGLLPERFSVLGVSRSAYTDDSFRARLLDSVREKGEGGFDGSEWDEFAAGIRYHTADLEDPGSYPALQERIRSLCAERGIPGNIIFYAAVAPKHYVSLIRRMGDAMLAYPSEQLPGYRRVVVEKPFGRDLESARALNREILSVFPDGQVYRIDHFLGKETVQNLFVFRFANGIFEPLWNRNYIDNVQITVAESIGVEGRGDYYDEAGAVRDMIQNHLLQLMALVAMEPPSSIAGDDLRGEKLKLLKSIRHVPEERVGEVCVRGQYKEGRIDGREVPAYRTEKRVSPGSFTETYAAMKLTVDNWRWAGVPFYLRTGKRMARKISEIAIQFHPAPSQLFKDTACGQLESNLLVINIQPEEGIFLRFGAKEPGPGVCVRPVDFHFTYKEAFGARSTPAYGRLLLDVMHGDPTLFPREEDVEASWALLEPFLKRWKGEPERELHYYSAGSWGPAEADALLEGGRDRWRRP
ncbi:MAG: glucose-6-phosphate dehydrogenase [Deltaproteobacteria bacterium]|nr:glucose-6-phosphate dehydrogenase [Deltaproteobacteria bacterium]